jgi:hypothetical protein
MRAPLAALAAAAAAALVLAGPSVQAQDSGSSAWDGSTITVPASSSSGSVHVEARFVRNPSRSVRITVHTDGQPPAGCVVPVDAGSGPAPTPATWSTELGFGCNGTYTITATARTTDDSPLRSADSASRATTVAIAMPAPTVTGVLATSEGRAITVTWNDMRAAAIDLSGYVVTRQVGSGPEVEVATVGPDQTAFVDDALPPEGGEATYSVASTRPSPERRLTSQSTSSEATPFVADPSQTDPGDGTTDPGTTDPGDGTTPGTTPGGGTPGAQGPGTPGAPGAPGTPGAGAGGRPGASVRAPRLGISGSFLPPLLRPSLSLQPPTTADEGFSEELPYGDQEPGAEDPVLPDDELASAFSGGAAGRGMAIPVATALVLAVWAFHLRFLARASRPLD